MTDQTPGSTPPATPASALSTQLKLQLQSVVTSALMIMGTAWFGKTLSDGTITGFANELAPLIVSAIFMIGPAIWKLLPMNASNKIALAEELPQVSRIVTTDAIANGPQFAANPTVVSYSQALATPPPAPVVTK